MKKSTGGFIFLLSIALSACARVHVVPFAQNAPVEKVELGRGAIQIAPALRSVPAREELEYQVSWWGLPVSTIRLTAQPISKKESKQLRLPRNLHKLTLQARSNWTLELFYPVRVKLVSFIDPKSVSPKRFEASVKRRWRLHESIVTFDRSKWEAFHQLPKGRSMMVPIHPATQDGLSLLYYVRTVDLHVGQSIPLEISADGKNWNLTARILRTRVLRLKEIGSFPAVEGAVELDYPVPFFQGAKALVWLSADSHRIPLYARIHSRIGPVTVVLTRREPVERISGNEVK